MEYIMQPIKRSIIIILLPAVFLTACKKQLNVFPTTQEVNGNVIVDVRSATTVLNGVYYQFAACGADYNSIPSTLWADVKEGYASELSGLFNYGYGGGSELTSHTYKAPSSEAQTMWTYGYNIVNAANGFLENIAPVKTIPDSIKREMIAEAKFLRAYADSYLLLHFGQYYDPTSPYGIILHNKFVTPHTTGLPRASVAEVYDSIIADINNAIPDLPNTNSTKAAANGWAAKLLMARVLINRGGAGDYARVIGLTRDIILQSPYSLEDSVKDIFLKEGLSSNEVIMGIQPFVSPMQSWKFFEYFTKRQYAPTKFMKSLFAGDPRKNWNYYIFVSPYGLGNQAQFSKYFPGDTTNPMATPIMEYSYAFRLTEAYLLEAEALNASGADMATAKDLLKTVMGHAGYSDFSVVDALTDQADLQQLIIREEMKNFVGEDGQDWLAVRRLPFAALQAWMPSLLTKDLLIMPIPQVEIQSNGLIKQNPGF
ncbi:RagB/SusD family nutrient uptake outer membrane protein [Flavitalea flava]